MRMPAAPTDPEGLRPAGEAPRILIAGIGNVFLGDDGFGVAVVEQLSHFALPQGAVLMDAGIRGLDLTYALLSDYDAAILIDAVRRGYSPGSICVLDPEVEADPEPEDVSNPAGLLDAHAMDPLKVLAFVRQSGSKLRAMRVVGCEPLTMGSDDDPAFGLSAPVRAAVNEAAQQVYALVAELQRELREPARLRGLDHA
jgi:hydrogenase maturation protease